MDMMNYGDKYIQGQDDKQERRMQDEHSDSDIR
jgi:hypothetical protein